jgi:hypothetical protein
MCEIWSGKWISTSPRSMRSLSVKKTYPHKHNNYFRFSNIAMGTLGPQARQEHRPPCKMTCGAQHMCKQVGKPELPPDMSFFSRHFKQQKKKKEEDTGTQEQKKTRTQRQRRQHKDRQKNRQRAQPFSSRWRVAS